MAISGSLGTAAFNKKLRGFTKKFVPKHFEKQMHKITLELNTNIVTATPVLTGRARGNWYASIGSPSGAINDAARDPSGAMAIARMVPVVVSAKMGQTLWFANNLPYIHKLEGGSSTQAPGGMFDVSVNAIRSKYGL